jgi:hypothetical protein
LPFCCMFVMFNAIMKCFTINLLFLLAVFFGNTAGAGPEVSIGGDGGVTLEHSVRREAAERSGDFMLRVLDDTGRFTYRINPLYPKLKKKYNWLRHAGSIYSICQLYESTGKGKYLDAANLATKNLVQQIRPTELNNNVFAVLISDPAITGSKPELGKVVKTGGCALAMIAMCDVDRLNDNKLHRGILLMMSDYIRFCQLPSGSLNSKYLINKQRFDAWQSQYYQGEALVALARVQKRYPTPDVQDTMVRLLVFLADTWQASTDLDRTPQRPVSRAFDHWGLLGLHACFELITDAELEKYSEHWTRERLLELAARYAEDELRRVRIEGQQVNIGCFKGREGEVTPTSIRLEGIQAAQNLVIRNSGEFTVKFQETPWWWEQRIDLALRFLLTAQYNKGHAKMWPDMPDVDGAFHRRAVLGLEVRNSEIRIDYCQHALSALLAEY